MPKFFRSIRWPKLLLVLALTMMLSLAANRVAAQSTSQLSAQISRLESQNSLLQSRISRLEAVVGRLGQASGVNLPPVPTAPSGGGASGLASDPMFNRLATLVIELRDRIIALEERAGIQAPGSAP